MKFKFAGEKLANYLSHSPDYTGVANTGMSANSKERQAAMSAEAQIEAARLGATAIEKAGAAQASATQFGGIMGGLSSGIAGGLGALGKKNTWDQAKSEGDSWFKANM